MIKNKIYIHFVIVLLIFFNCILFVSCEKENYNEKSYSYVIDDEIKYIDLEWNIGDINIVSGDKFLIEEASINEKGIAPLKYSINNQRLIVNYNDSKKKIKITLNKNKEYNDFSINSIASDITLNEINLQKFIVKEKKGVTNINSSSIDYVDIDITCQNNLACVEIKNNIFNTFKFKMEKAYFISLYGNKFNYCALNITKSNLILSRNIFKNIIIKTTYANINFFLYQDNGYNIKAFVNKIYIDFETININNHYLIGNASCNITCYSLNGILNIKRDNYKVSL